MFFTIPLCDKSSKWRRPALPHQSVVRIDFILFSGFRASTEPVNARNKSNSYILIIEVEFEMNQWTCWPMFSSDIPGLVSTVKVTDGNWCHSIYLRKVASIEAGSFSLAGSSTSEPYWPCRDYCILRGVPSPILQTARRDHSDRGYCSFSSLPTGPKLEELILTFPFLFFPSKRLILSYWLVRPWQLLGLDSETVPYHFHGFSGRSKWNC